MATFSSGKEEKKSPYLMALTYRRWSLGFRHHFLLMAHCRDLTTFCITLTRGNGNGGEQLDDKCFTYKIKHEIVDTEEYVCHKDHRKCDLKGPSYNDLCQYDCFLSSLSFPTWHQLVRRKLGWFENIKKKKNFFNVVSNTHQIVLFLPAQNLKLWKRALLPPSAFSQNQSEGGMRLVGN